MTNKQKRGTVLITGGSRGIGKSVALKFAKHNYDVIITYCSAEQEAHQTQLELEEAGSRSIAIKTDFLDAESNENLFTEFDRYYDQLDILINNAGWTKYIELDKLDGLTEEIFDKIITVDLKSVFFCCQYGIKRMKDPGSCIINISSIAAYNGIGSNIAYCAAKAGVVSITKSLARALGPKIRVNSIAPGLTETEMTWTGPKKYRDEQLKVTPLKRLALPEDIADVAFALVHNMKFVNGKTIVVDGGRLV